MSVTGTVPVVVIAGVSERCGKTTLTLGRLEALRGRGLAVQAFRLGPHVVDAAFHESLLDSSSARTSSAPQSQVTSPDRRPPPRVSSVAREYRIELPSGRTPEVREPPDSEQIAHDRHLASHF
jgi:hypothetical protein